MQQYPEFVSNSKFYSMDASKDLIVQWQAMAENIKQVHQLTTGHYDDLDHLIQTYLKAGNKIFKMQTGIVSHITDAQEYIIKGVASGSDLIKKGDVFELEGTYCREVYRSQKTLGFPHVRDIAFLQNHPCYVNLKLEAYISSPIFVRDKIYGTLNFSSTEPRANGFSESEHDLISMMAQAIGNFLLIQEREEHLKYLNFRMKELIGHVAHDLRNPLGAIRGLAEISRLKEMSAEKTEKIFKTIQSESEKTLDFVNKILDEAALGTGKVVMNKTVFSFSDVLNSVLKELAPLLDSRNISIKTDIQCKDNVLADEKRIEQLLKNLIINLAKYAHSSSVASVICTHRDNTLHIQLENQTSDEDIKLDNTLYKSIGFGIDISVEILEQHGSKLLIDHDADTYRVTFELPLNTE